MIYHHGPHPESFDDLRQVVNTAARTLKPHVDEFDTIAVTGVSGAAVGFPLALKLKKSVVFVRKNSDTDHHSMGRSRRIAGWASLGERALFVDDFVSSGTSRERVRSAVETVSGSKLVGTYEYRDHNITWEEN